MNRSRFIRSLLLFSFTVTTALGQAFTLSDTGTVAPNFREQFMASYGVNSRIEPEITPADRPLYERVEPFLRNNPREAIRIVAAEVSPETNAAFDFLLGNLYYQTGQYEQSERALQQTVRKFPSFRRAYRTMGLIQIQSERFEAAIETWLKVITLGGGDAQSYGLLGYAYLAQGKYRSALSAYQNARMFKPDSTDFRRGEAQCLLQTGQVKQAAALFDELIAEDPGVADYWLLQANAYLGLERYDEAMANLEILVGRGQATPQSAMLLGDLYLRDENHRLALETYRSALRTHQAQLGISSALRPLEYLLNRGLYDEAASYLEEVKAVLPAELEPEDQARLTVAKAGLALERSGPAEAIALLAPLVAAQPLAGQALLLLGEAYQETEQYEEAEFTLQRALSIPEKKTEARIALGRLEVSRGDFEAALRYLRRALEEAPQRPGLARYVEYIESAP
ncbi:MAG: tetratricopeptide repeat protein [Opitutales bacterium]